MSVIHEAVKRARSSQPEKTASRLSPEASSEKVPASSASPAILWVLAALALFEALALAWVVVEKSRTEGKLQSAYLELNDVRGEALDAKKGIVDSEARMGSENRILKKKLKELESVEFENLEKERTISGLTKRTHEAEMARYRLEEEVRALKAKLTAQESATPQDKPLS